MRRAPVSISNLRPFAQNGAGFSALGVIYLVVGMIALGSVVMATAASVLIVGVMMVIAGAAEIFNAFQIKTWGKFLIWLLLGALYVIAGFLTFQNPLLAAAVLTLMLGVALLISGIMRVILAFSMKQGMPWIWVLISGVVTLLLGLMILSRWPLSSLYVIGIFLGIDLVIAGASWIAMAFGLKNLNLAYK